jgi:RNA polymerase sigma factor, sigma-70 family
VKENDLKLIERVQTGDQEAYTQFVLNYSAYVYRTAFAFLHNKTEAEDASQEIFLKVYRSIHQLNEVQAFSAWFKKVISTVCLDHLKAKRPDTVPDSYLESTLTTPAGLWDRQIELREALGMLSPEEREVVVLHNWQGYSYQEIATLLEIPLGTVKSRLHTARMHLRTILSD